MHARVHVFATVMLFKRTYSPDKKPTPLPTIKSEMINLDLKTLVGLIVGTYYILRSDGSLISEVPCWSRDRSSETRDIRFWHVRGFDLIIGYWV